MPMQDLSDEAIASVISRYRAQGKKDGGPFTLAELLIEQRRRKPSAFPTVEVARLIVELSRRSLDGLVTYKQIWTHFRPDQPWQGHGSQTVVRDALYRVIGYCVAHGLPVLTVLVVRTQSRKLSDEAVANIYAEAKEFGLEVGLVASDFVRQEAFKSRSLSVEALPAEDI